MAREHQWVDFLNDIHAFNFKGEVYKRDHAEQEIEVQFLL